MSTEEGNILISKFMGYIYHKKVDVDNSDCGGIYTEYDIYSKIPILTEDYEDEGYKYSYFTEVPNPDYHKPGGHWNSDLKTLPWNSLYSDQYIDKLDYHENWNSLMEVKEKIEYLEDNDYIIDISKNICSIFINGHYWDGFEENTALKSTWKALVELIKEKLSCS